MACVLQQIQGDDHKIPPGSVLWEAIVWDALQGCLPWPSVSSSLQALNRPCWRKALEKSVLHLLLAFIGLFVCLFLWDYFKDLEVPTAPEAGPPCAARMFPLRQLRWQRMGKVRSPLSRCLTWMCCSCSSVS